MHAVLKYPQQDISFGVFQNKDGLAEFAMQVVKEAKGMAFTAWQEVSPNCARALRRSKS